MSLELNKREMMRYWGVKGTPNEQELIVAQKAEKLALGVAAPKMVYERFDCTLNDDTVMIGNLTIHSRDLAKCLKGCKSAVMLCSTVGIGIDNLINRYNGIDMALSTAVSACGSALIETYLDEFMLNFSKELKKNKEKMTPRFSPGYGDLSLSLQLDFFRILQITKRIGVTLNDSLLMTPTKSVTAIFGIKDDLNK